MNILLFDADRLQGDRLTVKGRQHTHLTEILAIKSGDRVRVGAIGGNTGFGEVISSDTGKTELKVHLEKAPPPSLPLTLILALPRPKMMRRIVQTVASLGIKTVHFTHSYKVDKSFWQTPWLQPDSLRENLLLGLEQSGDTLLPDIHLHKRFKPFVEDQLPTFADKGASYVAHPRTASPCPANVNRHVTLAVGPEGGFIDYELDKLGECGFEAITLGPRILRTETAIPVLTARLYSSI